MPRTYTTHLPSPSSSPFSDSDLNPDSESDTEMPYVNLQMSIPPRVSIRPSGDTVRHSSPLLQQSSSSSSSPRQYPQQPSYTQIYPQPQNADEDTMIRTGEASRLRRRGALRLDYEHAQLFHATHTGVGMGGVWLPTPGEPEGRRHRARVGAGGRGGEYNYVLVCGVSSPPSSYSPAKPSPLPIPPKKAKPTSTSTGCGAIISLYTAPRPRVGIWAALSAGVGGVAPLDAEYFEEEQRKGIVSSACGCLKEGVGCVVCGNPLGTIYKPCSALPHSPCARTKPPRGPTGPEYYAPHPSSSSPSSSLSSSSVSYTFFPSNVTSLPGYAFPARPRARSALGRESESEGEWTFVSPPAPQAQTPTGIPPPTPVATTPSPIPNPDASRTYLNIPRPRYASRSYAYPSSPNSNSAAYAEWRHQYFPYDSPSEEEDEGETRRREREREMQTLFGGGRYLDAGPLPVRLSVQAPLERRRPRRQRGIYISISSPSSSSEEDGPSYPSRPQLRGDQGSPVEPRIVPPSPGTPSPFIPSPRWFSSPLPPSPTTFRPPSPAPSSPPGASPTLPVFPPPATGEEGVGMWSWGSVQPDPDGRDEEGEEHQEEDGEEDGEEEEEESKVPTGVWFDR